MCQYVYNITISSNDAQQNETEGFFVNLTLKNIWLGKKCVVLFLVPISWNSWIISVFLKVTNNKQKGQNVSLFNHLVHNRMDRHLTFIFLADCVLSGQHNSIEIARCIDGQCKHWQQHYSIHSFIFFSVRVAGCCCFLFPWGVAGPNPVLLMGEGQGTPWMSRQLIAGPLLMAVAAPQGANCTSGAILGFSILLKDTLACSSVPLQRSQGFEPATSRSLVHQLYPLSYSRP